jgi:hypothetical protein
MYPLRSCLIGAKLSSEGDTCSLLGEHNCTQRLAAQRLLQQLLVARNNSIESARTPSNKQ